jgi:hypothetical protein
MYSGMSTIGAVLAIMFISVLAALCFIYTKSSGRLGAAMKSAYNPTPSAKLAALDQKVDMETRLDSYGMTIGPFPYGGGSMATVTVQYDAAPVVTLEFRRGESVVTYVSSDEFWVKYLHDNLNVVPDQLEEVQLVIIKNRQVLLNLDLAADAMAQLQYGVHTLSGVGKITAEELTRVWYPGYSHRTPQ